MKPILATTAQLDDIRFPVYASKKIDGIRCIVRNLNNKIEVLSRSLKPIQNLFVRKYLEDNFIHLPPGVFIDGELIAGSTFQECSSKIMTQKGEPDFLYNIFDCVDDINTPYNERLDSLAKFASDKIVIVEQILVTNINELENIHNKFVNNGEEGTIVRSVTGRYKFGRSTLKENLLLKIKPFTDQEFVCVGYEPYKKNLNNSKLNELGYKTKSRNKNNIKTLDMIGSLIVACSQGTFQVGTGFSEEMRKELWKIRDTLVGQHVKVKYMTVGIKNLPRHPVFLGIRDKEDL